MNPALVIARREVRAFFNSPVAYIVVSAFTIIAGGIFFFFKFFLAQEASLRGFFESMPMLFMFLAPAITMRLLADEKSSGTLELLITAPVRDWQVVLAKYFGALFFYIVLWIPTGLYFVIFQRLTGQPAATSTGADLGSYLMLLLLGMFYLSIGCFASVLTRNQIVAAIISFATITLLFFFGLVQFILLEISSETRQLLGYFSAIEQMGTLSRGQIDTRPIVLYLSMTILLLTFTYQAFQSRKWRL